LVDDFYPGKFVNPVVDIGPGALARASRALRPEMSAGRLGRASSARHEMTREP